MPSPSRSPLAWIACVVIVFWGCAGGGRHGSQRGGSLSSDYAGKTLAVILPDSASIARDDARILGDALLDAFPGPATDSAASVLVREFGNAFWSGFAPAVDFVTPVRVPDSVPAAPEGRRVGLKVPGTYGAPAHAYSAPDSAWLDEHGVEADLVLAVGPLSASNEQEEMHAYQFGGSIKINRLVLHGWFLIWDYSKGRAIAQGPFNIKLEYRGKPRARDWVKAFDLAMESVGEASPFRGPKWYRR